MIRGTLIGGGVGALVAAAQATRGENDPPDTVAREAAKGAAEGALVGGVIGAVVDWRTARRSPESGWAELPGTAVAMAQGLIESARPQVEQAAEVARERATEAAIAARPHVERAALLARERAEEAAVAARPRIEEAVEVARPVLAEAAQRTAQAFESTLEGGPTIMVKGS